MRENSKRKLNFHLRFAQHRWTKAHIVDAQHHIICGLPQPNHGAAVYIIRNLLRYIINFEEIAYHHCESRCTLMRDEIQRRHTAFDDIHRTSRGDDIPLLSQWIEKRASQLRCSIFCVHTTNSKPNIEHAITFNS